MEAILANDNWKEKVTRRGKHVDYELLIKLDIREKKKNDDGKYEPYNIKRIRMLQSLRWNSFYVIFKDCVDVVCGFIDDANGEGTAVDVGGA